jgi:hypothetical protein
MCAMLNVVVCLGLVPSQWCSAISVLIEKDSGNPNINRLRVIHLFEADYNLLSPTQKTASFLFYMLTIRS